MITMSLVLLLASIGAGFLGFSLLATGSAPAFLLFVVAAVLFSAGAIIEALRILRNDLRSALEEWAIRKGGLLLVAVLLAGCAQPITWAKDGATQEDFTRENFECERDARMMAGANRMQGDPRGLGIVSEISYATETKGFYIRCMESRGYRRAAQ